MIELDKRIIEGKKPLSAFDEMESKFIGTDCYFSDKPSDFADLSKCQVGKLMSLDAVSGMFGASKNNSYAVFCFCLPCEYVEEPETKYRAFTLAEWIDQYEIGDIIRYRCKSQKIELRHMYVGYAYGIGTDIKNTTSGTLTLGVASYTLDYLFEDYEIEVDGEWQPFGIEEQV